ncbi:DUF2163 domain-containing protein, partial [bacterium]|nr:DUF2163 domain-containing protein [bacterium]
LTQGVLKMRRGKLGEVTSSPQGWFQSELRGLTQLLQQNTIELYGPECRADLFDGRCASGGSLDADDWKAHLQLNAQGVGGFPNRWTTIAGVNGVDPTPPGYPSGIVANSGFFTYGVLQFTTGNNTGWRGEIKHHASGQIELFIQPPYPMQTNDEFDMWPGCDKSIGTCKSKFNNRLNFRGEPYLPGNDQVFFYPDAKS